MGRVLLLLITALLLSASACTRATPRPGTPPPVASPAATVTPVISMERAIEVASWPIPPEVLARAKIGARLERDVWVVTFENINATLSELRYPDGALDPQRRYQNVVVVVDARAGAVLHRSAYTPRGGAYISREEAIDLARKQFPAETSEADAHAYLRGEQWVVNFYGRNWKVEVDANTGAIAGYGRIFLSEAAPTPSPTPTSAPSPTPVLGPPSSPLSMTEPESHLWVADTVVVGEVIEALPEQRVPAPYGGYAYWYYRDWVVKVDNYVVKPLPYDRLIVKIWEATGQDSFRMPVKGPHLREGQMVLLLLSKEHGYWRPPSLADNEFTLAGGLLSAQVYVIENGQARHGVVPAPSVPLSELIARIRTAEPRVKRAVEITLANSRVKEELEGKEHEIGAVTLTSGEPLLYSVRIYLGRGTLPGVTLVAYVDLSQEKVRSISRELRPRELSQQEKSEVQRIALSDPEVLKRIGSQRYEVIRIEESSWTECCPGGKEAFYVFPAVELSIPPDPAVPGVILKVFVDLQAKRVVKVLSHFRKPPPPSSSSPGR